MKNLLLCCSFLIVSLSYAQRNTISTTGKWGQQIFLSDVNGQAFTNKYDGIAGSVYDRTEY